MKEERDRFQFERSLLERGMRAIAGVDEAGRGPLAGPVVVAAVVLPVCWIHGGLPSELKGLNDSKRLTAIQRERFFEFLKAAGEVRRAVVRIEAPEIDSLNILRATHLGMSRCLEALGEPLEHVLVDGLAVASLSWEQTAIVKGDSKSFSIAAASIMAKVSRDNVMEAYHREYSDYGFHQNKGYPTRAHLKALDQFGPCPIHRKSFGPVRQRQLDLF